VLPQSSNLSFPFTVREIVQLGTREGVTDSDPATVSAALDRVDLAGFEGRMYQELSGGEQQRVQLARVLCQVWSPVHEGKARYLFLDEPVSSLDIRHQFRS
jgi:iron complex transport system ATP-binding protein